MYSGYDQRGNKNLDINAAIEVWNQVNTVIKKQKSVRTNDKLIIGFYGGEPLTAFTGDRMIRPDSEVVPVDGGAVEVVCYDGKKHTVKISDK